MDDGGGLRLECVAIDEKGDYDLPIRVKCFGPSGVRAALEAALGAAEVALEAPSALELLPPCERGQMEAAPGSRFLHVSASGGVSVAPAGSLDELRDEDYEVAVSPLHVYTLGKTMTRTEIGIAYCDGSVATEVRCDGVVLRGGRADGTPGEANERGRRFGVQYCRVSLPRAAFGKVYGTLARAYPSIMELADPTEDFFSAVAGWGTKREPCTFTWRQEEDGEWGHTTDQTRVHQMFGGQSFKGVAWLTLSIKTDVKGCTQAVDEDTAKINVTLHRFLLKEVCDRDGRAVEPASPPAPAAKRRRTSGLPPETPVKEEAGRAPEQASQPED